MIKEHMGLIVKRDDGSEQVNYDDPSFPSYIYDGWIKPNVTWEKVPHFHDDIEMISVKSGTMAYSVNGKLVMLHEGDTIFVNSNQIHYSMSIDGGIARYVIFIANPSILNASVAVETQALLPIIANPDISYISFRHPNEHTEALHELMMSLPDLRRDPFHITMQFYAIWEILLKTVKSWGMLSEETAPDIHMQSFKSMMYYIQKEYQNPITLDAIAASGNVSRSMCNKLFHHYVGDSPINYLVSFRLRKVAEYLRTNTLSLTEIAELTGFNGTSYMSEMFKKEFDMSPRDFKKTWAAATNAVT